MHPSAYDRTQGREIDSAAFDLVPITTEAGKVKQYQRTANEWYRFRRKLTDDAGVGRQPLVSPLDPDGAFEFRLKMVALHVTHCVILLCV